MELRSFQFRKEREDSWRELEGLVLRAEKKGLSSLSPKELFRLPMLYRSTLSSLSVARAISLETNVVSYLENLVNRAYFLLYGVRGKTSALIWKFLTRSFPQQVRKAFPLVLLSAFTMAFGVLVGFFLTQGNPDWFYTFVSNDMAAGRGPTASTEELRKTIFSDGESALNMLTIFSTFLFTHNARVGMFAFALGFAFGLPTLLLLFYTGGVLGAFLAVFESRGLGFDFMGWIIVHGSTELTAIILCGAAGLVLGKSIVFPSQLSRRESLGKRGKGAAVIVIGAVLMFFVAGLLEGYARQLVQDTNSRYLIGSIAFGLWVLYFSLGGRTWRKKPQ